MTRDLSLEARVLNELIKLRNRGLSLIPVAGKRSPDKDGAKRPLINWQEFQDRIATEEEIKSWLNLYPNGDIGIVTGPVSRILVLDVDGEEGLSSLKGINLPPTWTVKTKRGWHYYFRWVSTLDGKVTTKAAIKPGLDVRGEGGYVVAPPSAGYNGTPYQWHRAPHIAPLAVPPEWLVSLLPTKGTALKSPEPKASSKSWLLDSLNGIKEGNRNDSFTKVAGSLRARGYEAGDIFELLKGKAAEVDFPLGELDTICQSIGKYSTEVEPISSNVETFLEDMEKVEWICNPILAKKTIGFVAGLPETMKTWLLIDLAIECARSGTEPRMWLNRFPVNPARVLFIDQERFKGETQRRFRAVLSAKNIAPKDIKNSLFIRCGTTTRINLQSSFDSFRKELAEIQPDVVIVDSFATFHTAEENNRKDIQEVLEHIKQLRNEFGCTFMFIHHENKFAFHSKEDDRAPSIAEMAGSVAIPAAAEFVLTVRRQDSESSFVYHTKSTLAATVQPFLVKVTDLNEEKSKIQVEAF
jgi:hypothetical protein